MHAPLSSLGPPAALSIPPQWGLQGVSLAPMPLMPSLAPEVDLLSNCQEAMGMPGNPMAPASSKSTNEFGERLSHAICCDGGCVAAPCAPTRACARLVD